MNKLYRVLYDFLAEEDGELSVKAGDLLQELNSESNYSEEGWTYIQAPDLSTGFVPTNYIEEITVSSDSKQSILTDNQTSTFQLNDSIKISNTNDHSNYFTPNTPSLALRPNQLRSPEDDPADDDDELEYSSSQLIKTNMIQSPAKFLKQPIPLNKGELLPQNNLHSTSSNRSTKPTESKLPGAVNSSSINVFTSFSNQKLLGSKIHDVNDLSLPQPSSPDRLTFSPRNYLYVDPEITKEPKASGSETAYISPLQKNNPEIPAFTQTNENSLKQEPFHDLSYDIGIIDAAEKEDFERLTSLTNKYFQKLLETHKDHGDVFEDMTSTLNKDLSSLTESLDGMYNQISEIEEKLFQERKKLTLKEEAVVHEILTKTNEFVRSSELNALRAYKN